MSSDASLAAPVAPAAPTDAASAAIRIRGLSKAYQVFARPEDRLKQMLLGRWRRYYREFWAVRELDLDVGRGEVVGIVGRNGSGKSTLLQMICGTLTPSAGSLQVHGRIAALLELGAGFNPEFSGRDNVFLNGAILGMDQAEMERRYDAIAAFADIGEFLNQPVKTYSSGMYARLAFAVAINVDPQILIVDEALSVGDEAFQRKCYVRLRAIRDAGATVLFVSHSPGTIISLCDRAVLLDHGRRLLTADPKTVIAKYQRLAYAPAEQAEEIRAEIVALDAGAAAKAAEKEQKHSQQPMAANHDPAPSASPRRSSRRGYFDPNLKPKSTVAYVERGVSIEDATIVDADGQRVNVLVSGEVYRYRYQVSFDADAFGVRFGMMIKDITGVELAGCASHAEDAPLRHVEGGQRLEVSFEFRNLLSPGVYFLNAGVLGSAEQGQGWLARVLDVAMFRVEPSSSLTTGLVNLMTDMPVQVRPIAESAKVGA